MNVGLKQRRQDVVHQAVALQRSQTLEARGHDFQVKVPFACCTVMSGMRAAVIAHLQMRRLQMLLQQLLDLRSGGLSGVCHEYLCHGRQAGSVWVREESHSACSSANRNIAAVRPNTLKFTQVLSLALNATHKFRQPSIR